MLGKHQCWLWLQTSRLIEPFLCSWVKLAMRLITIVHLQVVVVQSDGFMKNQSQPSIWWWKNAGQLINVVVIYVKKDHYFNSSRLLSAIPDVWPFEASFSSQISVMKYGTARNTIRAQWKSVESYGHQIVPFDLHQLAYLRIKLAVVSVLVKVILRREALYSWDQVALERHAQLVLLTWLLSKW